MLTKSADWILLKVPLDLIAAAFAPFATHRGAACRRPLTGEDGRGIVARQNVKICALVKLAEQGLGLLQIARLESFGEPVVDGREQVACHFAFTLIIQEFRGAGSRAQFP